MIEIPFRILIVDDEPNIRSGLAKALVDKSYQIVTAGDVPEALEVFRREPFHLVFADLKMPGPLSGLDLVKQIKEDDPETQVIVLSAHGTITTAVEAMRLGAQDFIVKPPDLDILRMQVRKANELFQVRQENRRLRWQLSAKGELPELIGQSAAMSEVFVRVRQVADTDVTVLIEGESGTGKELIARAIHKLSLRREKPFIAANIGALPESLVESELFGYEKGAFSGAHRRKPGWFEMAREGTLFLDEIGDMLPKTQVDLLRVLEQREVRRLGGEDLIPLDVRLVVATHRDIEELVTSGQLREDVYYRLNVVPLRVPSLRERRDDIPLLAESFLNLAQERFRREPKQITEAAMRILCNYAWPGNVRQLRNCMERLMVTVEGPIIHAEDLPAEMHSCPRQEIQTLEEAVREAECSAILAALERCNQHREHAAHLLGISVRTLHYKMNRYSLQ